MYGLRGGRRFGRGMGWYGLGFTYYDLLAQANLQNCSPLDPACVAGNQQKQAAVEDLWVNDYESNPNTAGAPAPTITVTPNLSSAVVGTPTSLFEQNAPANEAVTTVNGRTFTTPQLEGGPVVFTSAPDMPGADYSFKPWLHQQNCGGGLFATLPPDGNQTCPGAAPAAAAPSPAPAKPPAPGPAPALKPQAQGAPVLSPTLGVPQDMTGGFSLGSIPLWGWAAAAGVALLAFGGHKR